MNITGIIAEFNPLHKGHERLITGSRSDSGACVVLMSSNFTQRGSPAIVDETLRAEMAIKAGADLVLELPFIYSCSAGQDFARGAVEILGRLNFITHIAFGMEDSEYNIEPLINVLLHENQDYKNFLKRELNSGASFAKAHSIALEKLIPGTQEFITKPNNMLALSYMLEIRRHDYNINAIAMKREGNYSSKLIRDYLAPPVKGERARMARGLSEEVMNMLPEYSRELLVNPVDEENLWPFLKSVFIRSKPEDLQKIYGIDEGIENLFLKHCHKSTSLNDFIGRCICARYTRAHIRRRLVYILLGLDRWEMFGALRSRVPYVRVLAFNDTGQKILREHKKDSDIKIITRLKAAEDKVGKYFADVELKAGRLYELLL